MNRKAVVIRISGMAAATLLLIGSAVAQVQPSEKAAQDQQVLSAEQVREFHPKLERTDKLIGMKVVDHRGKWLGTIQEIVLTPDRNIVDYVVLEYGGFWGVPAKLFAVPWAQLQAEPQERAFVLEIDRRELDRAKGLDKNYWPTTTSADWLALGGAVRRPPQAGEREGVAIVPVETLASRRLSKLVGFIVENPQGQGLGQVADFVLDTSRGQVVYAVVSLPPTWPDPSRHLVAVPWSVFEVFPQFKMARLDADRRSLEALAFRASEFPKLADAQYNRRLHERFGATPYWETLGYVPAERQY